MSIFKAEDFRDYCIKNPGAPHDECIAAIANAKRDEVREILEQELIKVRAEREAAMKTATAFSKQLDAARAEVERAHSQLDYDKTASLKAEVERLRALLDSGEFRGVS